MASLQGMVGLRGKKLTLFLCSCLAAGLSMAPHTTAQAQQKLEPCFVTTTPECVAKMMAVSASSISNTDVDSRAAITKTYLHTMPLLKSLEARRILSQAALPRLEAKDDEIIGTQSAFKAALQTMTTAMVAPGSDWESKLQHGDFAGALDAIPPETVPFANDWNGRIFKMVATAAFAKGHVNDVIAYLLKLPAKPASEDPVGRRKDMVNLAVREAATCQCADQAMLGRLVAPATVENLVRRLALAGAAGNREELRREMRAQMPDLAARTAPAGDKGEQVMNALRSAMYIKISPALVDEMPAFAKADALYLDEWLSKAFIQGDAPMVDHILLRRPATKAAFLKTSIDAQTKGVNIDAMKALTAKFAGADRDEAVLATAQALIYAERTPEALELLKTAKLEATGPVVTALAIMNMSKPLKDIMSAKMPSTKRAEFKSLIDDAEREWTDAKMAGSFAYLANTEPLNILSRKGTYADVNDMVAAALKLACKESAYSAALVLAEAKSKSGQHADHYNNLAAVLNCMNAVQQ